MTTFAPGAALARPARIVFIAAASIFTYTIVIGILNGLDVWTPGHDTLMSHVHSGTLGWITLSVSGIAFLLFSQDRQVDASEQRRAVTLAWSLVVGITLYVLAFLAGTHIFSDRIQRPIVGTLLFVVVIAMLVWMVKAYRAYTSRTAARLGILLAWISLLIGAVFGILLGVYTANGKVPGLDNKTAARFADAHPPAMVIGYLLVAGFAVVEWLLHDKAKGRAGFVQMWLLFVAGVIINIAFVTGKDKELAGPANLLMIAAGITMLWRSRAMLSPKGWRGAGVGRFPRLALIFLIGYLVLLTVLVSWIVQDTIDFDALTTTQNGLLLAFDHTMFIGVMTNVVFGVLASRLNTPRTALANRVLWWGLPVGLTGFAIGLITSTVILKRIFAPIMGLSLLFALAIYLRELRASSAERAQLASS
ncbi:hypothetical protein BH10ACT2_BH10ACT2_28790 [soil metagenome]